MLTVLEIIKKTTEFFEKRGIENSRLNAELLVGQVLGLKRMQLYLQFERPLTEPELERLRPLVRRRGAREPLQYILGSVEFCGLRLKVDRRALIPRPETEGLVELVRARRPVPPRHLVDLGTGSGAIALACATAWPEAGVTAVDASAEALALARENADALGLGGRIRFIESDWFERVPPQPDVDLIVANPPYLSEAEVAEAAPEVRDHEPLAALASGPGGAEDVQAILRAARARLAAGGLLALETGITQHAALLALARELGYAEATSHPDLTGRDRYVLATA